MQVDDERRSFIMFLIDHTNHSPKGANLMKIALVGPGFIAQVHAQELANMGREISVVAGSSERKASAFQKDWHIPECVLDFNRVLQDDITVVHVCTPPALHYDMVKKLILAGKHVICEKPLCTTADQARELCKLAQEKGVVAAVNFNVRYHEACQRFQKKIQAGELGRLILLHGTYEQEFHVLPAEYSWRYMEETAGPMRATTEIGSHWIDLARFLTGLEITSVSASFGRFTPERYVKDGMMYEEALPGSEKVTVDSDDAVVCAFRLYNGALGSLFLSEVTHGRSNDLSIEITGTQKTISWNSENPYQLRSAAKFGGTLCETNAFGGGFPNTFSGFFREVHKDIDAGRPSPAPAYPTFLDGYQNAAVCEAICESAGNGSVWTDVK